MKKLLFATAALAFVASAGVAMAHDDEYYQDDFGNAYQHQLDHAEHQRFHREFAYQHARAHDEDFYSSEEHDAWHRANGEAHRDFHDDHPNTWHDHYRRHYDRGYYRNGYYGHPDSYGYPSGYGRSFSVGGGY